MKIKVDYRRAARYTDEEKRKLFQEGLIRVPSPIKNKKKYNRKIKHKGKEVD